MSHAFRELLRKVGSGTHTNEPLTRQQSAAAMGMMLTQDATPAQIGAFMIAHRIRRPTGEELAGMLDAYDEFGPKLQSASSALVTVMGIPYDGRTRTAPLAPLTALVLATAGCPVIQHGGDRMPTKEGDPLILFWQALGVDWAPLPLSQVQHVLEQTGVGFVYLPTHFPKAQALVPYREQIGKRPPLATMELMWCPYSGDAHVVSGFVHPPTEAMFQDAFARRGVNLFTTVKGLEGSCDLPRERTAIIGMGNPNAAISASDGLPPLDRLHLHPREFGFENKNVPLENSAMLLQTMKAVLDGQDSDLLQSIVWNSSFYLWRCGAADSIAAGITKAEQLLSQGAVKRKLQDVQTAIAPVTVR
jgi:anthranilate phosphoribosyltransferase